MQTLRHLMCVGVCGRVVDCVLCVGWRCWLAAVSVGCWCGAVVYAGVVVCMLDGGRLRVRVVVCRLAGLLVGWTIVDVVVVVGGVLMPVGVVWCPTAAPVAHEC